MGLLVSRCLEHIEHALHGELDGRIDALGVVNEAGEWLTGAHDWKWLERPPTTVTITGLGNTADLPADFGSLSADPQVTGRSIEKARLVTLAEIDRLEQSLNTITAYDFYVAVEHYVPSASGTPTPRLRVWPAPSTDTSLSIVYRAGWEFVEKDTAQIELPSHAYTLFFMAIRELALGYEEPEGGDVAMRLGKLRTSQLFLDVQRADGRVQPNYGRLRGGHTRSGRYHGNPYLSTTVADPS